MEINQKHRELADTLVGDARAELHHKEVIDDSYLKNIAKCHCEEVINSNASEDMKDLYRGALSILMAK